MLRGSALEFSGVYRARELVCMLDGAVKPAFLLPGQKSFNQVTWS
jgi:hypothetical protein